MTVKKRVHSRHNTKSEAQKEAARLRAKKNGKKYVVRKDPLTGKWIVEVIFLVFTLGVLSSLLRHD